MNLSKYDNKCIQLTDFKDDIYEGYCRHNSKDYTYHEFGVEEESVQITCVLFYKSQIKKIKSLENNRGLYGKFTSKYGKLEEVIVEGGADLVEEILDSEEEEHLLRTIKYFNEVWLPKNRENEETKKIIDLLKKYDKYIDNQEVKEYIKNSHLLEN